MNPECHGHFHGTLTIDIVIPVAAGRPGDVGIKSGEGSGQEKKGSTVHRRGDKRGDRKSGPVRPCSPKPYTPEGIRTPDLRIRSPLLYPTELQAR